MNHKKLTKKKVFRKRALKNSRKRSKRGGVKRKGKRKKTRKIIKPNSHQILTVGPRSSPSVLYAGPYPELTFPKKVSEGIINKEIDKQNKNNLKTLKKLRLEETRFKRTGLPLKKKKSKNPELLQTKEEKRIRAELDSPWGF